MCQADLNHSSEHQSSKISMVWHVLGNVLIPWAYRVWSTWYGRLMGTLHYPSAMRLWAQVRTEFDSLYRRKRMSFWIG
jgi:hypothetical protein